jgi:uncharacterized protein (TIGR02145 family)
MKKFSITLVFVLIFSSTMFAQAPQAINYQAIVRDTNGVIISDQNVNLKISILSDSVDGVVVYSETHDVITNSMGLINIRIGRGQVISGIFENINWGITSYYLKTEADLTGGSIYLLIGISQLISVPYSFYSGLSGALVLTDIKGNKYSVSIDTLGNLYTTNMNTWSCGDPITDSRDGNVYNTVQIGSQCWMADNLAYLPSVSPSGDESNALPIYYVYDYQGTDVNAAKATINYQTYGVLYNWPAAMAGAVGSNSIPSGVQGICPSDWHLPSDEEWKILEGEVDSQYGYPDTEWDDTGWRGADAGSNLKEAGTTHWNSTNTGTNLSGFTALPGGGRYSGSFYRMGDYAYFWSSTENSSSNSLFRRLRNYYDNVFRDDSNKEDGFSLRCLKD